MICYLCYQCAKISLPLASSNKVLGCNLYEQSTKMINIFLSLQTKRYLYANIYNFLRNLLSGGLNCLVWVWKTNDFETRNKIFSLIFSIHLSKNLERIINKNLNKTDKLCRIAIWQANYLSIVLADSKWQEICYYKKTQLKAAKLIWDV